MNNDKLELKKTEYGFYQYSPLPSESELQNYYSKKYYQEGKGSYEINYDDEELFYNHIRFERIAVVCEKLYREKEVCRKFLEIGCGEGWLLDCMYKRNYKIEGTDFSSFGLSKWNKHLLPYFIEGNIYDCLYNKVKNNEKYDLIFMGNVIEHVVDPVKVIELTKQLLDSNDSILVIVAPNDFSDLQEYIIKNNFVTKPWWLGYPDHLSYFSADSMCNFMKEKGFKTIKIMGDYPIEFNLFSPLTNYKNNPDMGKAIHRQRILIDNYLSRQNLASYIEILLILGSMKIGRNLIYFLSPI
jgi:2-polyprenyl-3-methyl-5-hydroxy-6-metoxy-1,4-benzoquinol methylase